MAEKLSPSLSGIQKVAGSKMSDKLNTLNRIAKKIVDSENQNEAMQLAVDSSELPEVLKPLVQVEVARLSGQFEGICEALKSDDSVVVDRALRAKWFFNGSHENCRVQYYQAQIFPVVSLQNRLKIIKALANNLTAKPAIADEFYTALISMYEEKQAHLLLMACSESFIWDRIEEHKLRLHHRMVRILFDKYPELICKYLKLSKKKYDKYERNSLQVDFRYLRKFLPRLVKKYPDTLVVLTEEHNPGFLISLSQTRTKLFLKSSIDALMRNPKLFFPMLDSKIATKILTDSQLRSIIKQLFPATLEYFQFDTLMGYLFDLPEEKVLPLITSVFKEVYKVNFLDCPEKITPRALRLLPRVERNKQAIIKLRKEPTDYFSFSTRSWICYFPCFESILLLKNLIGKTSDDHQRCELLQQLIFTCILNSDSDALLEVLKYIAMRHQNESGQTLVFALRILLLEYDLKNLTRNHWDVIDSLVKLVYAKNGVDSIITSILDLIKGRIRFDLENNCSITNNIRLLAEYNVVWWTDGWNILQDNLAFNRKCLEEFIKVLSSLNESKKAYITCEVIGNVLSSIYDFNKRNSKAKSTLEMMSIKNYPWLYCSVEKFINDKDQNKKRVRRLKEVLREGEAEVFDELVTEDDKKVDVQSPKVLKLLKNHPEKILKDWELYLEKCMENIGNPWARRFLKLCRWYQDLPIKFADKSFNEVIVKKRATALIVLGLLFDGPALEPVVESFEPPPPVIDSDDEDDEDNDVYRKCMTPLLFNVVNPPVSLEFVLDICESGCIQILISCLLNVTRRTALPKVISFTTTMMTRQLSIKKHGIRLFRTVGDVKQSCEILMNLWRSERHPTIRAVVFKNVLKVFESVPNDETWGMICECIDGLKMDDKDTFKSFMKFKSFPKKYVADYFRKLFRLFCRFDDEKYGWWLISGWFYISKLLNVNENILVLFPDELHNEIIDNSVLDLSLPEHIQSAGHNYLINYIRTARDKLEDRLNRFRYIFVKIVKENWNKPHPTARSFYPAKLFVKNLTTYLIKSVDKLVEPSRIRLMQVAFESFNSTLKPQQNPEFYLHVSIVAALSKNRYSPKEVACKVNELLPTLITIFSAEIMPFIASILNEYLKSYFQGNTIDRLLDVVEGLIELNNDPAAILAAHLLSLQNRVGSDSRLTKIVHSLTEHSNPVAVAIASMKMYELL